MFFHFSQLKKRLNPDGVPMEAVTANVTIRLHQGQ
jgi:hypothetical protein